MKIYLATSWNNPYVDTLKQVILECDHTYYHFLESGFELDYDRITPGLRGKAGIVQAAYIQNPLVQKAASVNRSALESCHMFLLAEPANKGSYTEFGLAIGLKMKTLLYVTPKYTIGVMDAMFDEVVDNLRDLRSNLNKK